jgi:hypothetical protein
VVAIAAKNARVAWAMVSKGELRGECSVKVYSERGEVAASALPTVRNAATGLLLRARLRADVLGPRVPVLHVEQILSMSKV